MVTKNLLKRFEFDQILIRFLHFQPVLFDYLSSRSEEHGILIVFSLSEPGALSEFLRARIVDYIVVYILKDVVRGFVSKQKLTFYAQRLSKLFTRPYCVTLPYVLLKKDKY